MVSKRKQQLYFIKLFGLWAGAKEKWVLMFSLSHSFCGSVPARSVRSRDWYLLHGRILFWSAISCGSELIVGAFVQKVQQTSFSDTRYIQDVSWMAVSHVSMCDEMSMRHRRWYPESKWLFVTFSLPWYFVLWSVNDSSFGRRPSRVPVNK